MATPPPSRLPQHRLAEESAGDIYQNFKRASSSTPENNSTNSTHAGQNASTEVDNGANSAPVAEDAAPYRPSKISVYRRVFRLASPKEKFLYLSGIVCSVGSGTILPLMTLIFGNFVSIFTEFATGAIDPNGFKAKINHYTLYFVYLFIGKLGLSYISQVIFAIVSTRIAARLRQLYLRSMLSRCITFHETSSSSGAVSLALSSHSNTIQSGLSDKFGLSVQNISTVISAFVVAFTSQWKLSLVTATIIPATVLGVGITSAFDSKFEDALNATKAEAATLAEEILGSIRTALALRARDKLLMKYKTYLDHAASIGQKRAPILGMQTAIYMFMTYAAYALAFWYGIHLFAKGEAQSSGKVITTLFSIIIGTNAFAQLAGYIGSFLRISTAGVELLKVIDEAPNTTSRQFQESVAWISSNKERLIDGYANEDISFSNVTFSYPLRPGIPVLKEFSLDIRAGKMTALVGPSGSGKSTVLGLLERWYDTDEGSIKLGSTNIDNIPAAELRGKIGLVQQEPFLFSASIFENILYGLPQQRVASLSDSEKYSLVVDACKVADAHDFVEALPEGYRTFVGNKASLLSGGQKQRLAIARAIIGNPAILIFDEATSALDPASEKVVQQALDRAAENRTTIAIAHRLSTIRNSDNIVVLNHGSIVEQGTHEELLGTDGVYRKLLAAQTLLHGGLRSVETSFSTHSYDQPDQDFLKRNLFAETIAGESPGSAEPSEMGIFRTLGMSFYDQRQHWIAFLILFICCVIGGALFPLQAYFYSQVVTAFQYQGSKLINRGDFWALMFFILALVVGLAYFAIAGVGEFLSEQIAEFYRFLYFKNMFNQSIAFFDDSANSSGSLTSRLATDPDAVKSLAGPNLGVMIVVGVSILSTVILSLAVGWKLGLVATFGALPFIFVAGLVHESMEQRFEKIVSETFSDSVGFASECIQAIKTVNSLNMEGRIEDHFGTLLKDHCAKAQCHAIKSMIWFALSESIELLCMGLTFWYGGQLLASHEYSTGQFFIVFVAIVLGAQSSGQFFAQSLDIKKGKNAYNEVRSLGLSVLKDVNASEHTVGTEKYSSETLIEFKNARFAYPARPLQSVLRGLDLKLEKGQFIALVGPSGCGKSTVLSLLERFYDLNGGELLFNGVEVSQFPRHTMRGNLALVSQEPVLYQGTICENILLGTTTDVSDTNLDRIVKQAQIFDLIQSLPEGYSTQVGSRGTALSGGQKQRIAIARAIAMDKEILLLDEATSALDSESEALIYEALMEAGRGRTIVAVSHRLSTIQHADVIYVLKEGSVGESGTHAELLEKRGLYFHMCESQGFEVQS